MAAEPDATPKDAVTNVNDLGELSFDSIDDSEIQVDDDTGELTIRVDDLVKKPEPAQQPTGTPSTPASPSTEQPSATPPAGYVEEKRYKDLQAEFTRRSQRLADLEKQFARFEGREEGRRETAQSGSPGTPDPLDLSAEDFAEVLADPQRRRQVFEQAVDKLFETKYGETVRALEPMIEQQKRHTAHTQELVATYQKYGKDFLAALPQIQAIYQRFPHADWSYEDVFGLVQHLKAGALPATPAGSTPATPSASSDKGALSAEDAARLKQDAARMRPQEGVGSPPGDPGILPEPEIKTPMDAARAAWAEIVGT